MDTSMRKIIVDNDLHLRRVVRISRVASQAAICRGILLSIAFINTMATATLASPWAEHGKLEVSKDGHYLQHEDGLPFPWIGDTAWGLFTQLDRAEVERYLDSRQKSGFNVIQSVPYWYRYESGDSPGGPHNPANVYGHRPFEGGADSPDTAQPRLMGSGSPEARDGFWEHADFIVKEIRKRGMYLALLPCWGSAYVQARQEGSHVEFDEQGARGFGEFLGRRYADDPHIIWVIGGDVDPVNHGVGDRRHVYRAMAEGVGRGVSGNPSLKWNEPHSDWDKTLMTFHAVQAPPQREGGSSSIWFHEDPWLDMNMMETWAWPSRIYPLVSADYELSNPAKPTILGEGAYEYGDYLNDCGWVTPRLVRQQGYHSFFAGATGYTYGAFPVWSFRGAECGLDWKTGLRLPGAYQTATIMKSFLERHQWWQWESAQSVSIEGGNSSEAQIVAVATGKDELLIYFPSRDIAQVNTKRFEGRSEVQVEWFSLENGSMVSEVVNIVDGSAWIQPPEDWEDAILIVQKNGVDGAGE